MGEANGGREMLLQKVAVSPGGCPRAPVAPASTAHGPGFPGWVPLLWEGALSISQLFQSRGPFTSCFPSSLPSFQAHMPPGSRIFCGSE